MANQLDSLNISEPSNRGGKRAGAGRPKGTSTKAKWLMARGINPIVASDVLAHIDERRQWLRIFESDDDSVVLKAMMFLVQMRDGKPSQQLNITATSIHIDAATLVRAREIARELTRPTTSQSDSVVDSPKLGLAQPTTATAAPSQLIAQPNDCEIK